MFNNKQDIIDWLKQMNYQDYIIHDNLVVDIDGDVDLVEKNLKELPIQFGEIKGYFDCSLNQLTHLKGSPHTVYSWFNCQANQLKTLEGGPQIVGDSYDCSSNELHSLEGSPKILHKTFFASHNKLLSLLHCPKEMKGSVFLDFNYLTSLKGIGHCELVLDISENNLTSLECIPNKLETLYCQFNPLFVIDYLPHTITHQLSIDYLGLDNMLAITQSSIGEKIELHQLNQYTGQDKFFKPNAGFNFMLLNIEVFNDYIQSYYEKKCIEKNMAQNHKKEKQIKI